MIPQKLFLFHYGALEMTFNIILQKTAFSLVKGRLALGGPSWLVVRHHAEDGLIHKKIVIGCPLVITTIGDTLY